MQPDRELVIELAKKRAVEAVRREFFRRYRLGVSTVMDYRAHYTTAYRVAYRQIWDNMAAMPL
jgi:hypothetical protein